MKSKRGLTLKQYRLNVARECLVGDHKRAWGKSAIDGSPRLAGLGGAIGSVKRLSTRTPDSPFQ